MMKIVKNFLGKCGKVFLLLRWSNLRRMKKRYWIIIIVVFSIIGFNVWGNFASQQQWQASAVVSEVVRQDLIKELIRSGKVELQGVFQVTPKISGVIKQLKVTNGQKVKANEMLFQIKSDASAAEKASAYASFLGAKNTYQDAKNTIGHTEWIAFEQQRDALVQAEDKLKKFREQYPDRLKVDDTEYQSLLTEVNVAKRRIEMATLEPSFAARRLQAASANYQAALATYQATLDEVYRSPINGTIENLSVNEGEKVTAGVGEKTKGTPLFYIVPEGKKTISMQVGGRDINQLHVGQTAIVKDKLLKDQEFSATIVRMDKIGTQSEGGKSMSYRVLLELDQETQELSFGNAVEIKIEVERRENVLTVPVGAVKDGQVTITNQSKQRLGTRNVETGLKAGGYIEIISGLSEGELVLEEFEQ